MTMNRDLFLAILSMDSYNRGYGQGITGLSESSQIGNASVITRTSIFGENANQVFQGWQFAGFYALAYDMTGVSGFADGERVIAYRGSDAGRTQDILLGYTTALGLPSIQGSLAIDFARAVIGTNTLPTSAGNVTVTGHSLGGGLAGYVGNIYGWNNVLYDPMPYSESVVNAYVRSLTNISTSASIYGAYLPTLPDFSERTVLR